MKKYQNELLGKTREEIIKMWDNVWTQILSLDPVKDYNELVELNKRFDKCVEAYYAVDCGSYWKVTRASRVNENNWTLKVMKETSMMENV